MFESVWDAETGGFTLQHSSRPILSEPKPVYASELNLLKMDRFFDYDPDDNTYPLMWLDRSSFIYRGERVAYQQYDYKKPEPMQIISAYEDTTSKLKLEMVDVPAMLDKNAGMIRLLEEDSVLRAYSAYQKYKDQVEGSYVAFSGGKDSIVMLDIVQKALPHNLFNVSFNDTDMECPDTYDTVKVYQDWCRERGINMVIAKSKWKPEESWPLFAPPAVINRWCCSVHKSAALIQFMRRYFNKPEYHTLTYLGIRARESVRRSKYAESGSGKLNQCVAYPIIEWSAPEVWDYIWRHNLPLNQSYIKGARRVGCLICPMAADSHDWYGKQMYPEETERFYKLIREYVAPTMPDEKDQAYYAYPSPRWKARKNGIFGKPTDNWYDEVKCADYTLLCCHYPTTDWQEWFKTIGVVLDDANIEPDIYYLLYRDTEFHIKVTDTDDGFVFWIPNEWLASIQLKPTAENLKDPAYIQRVKYRQFMSALRIVLKRATHCVACGTCEANCRWGRVSFKGDSRNPQLCINDDCTHCANCHFDAGCLVFASVNNHPNKRCLVSAEVYLSKQKEGLEVECAKSDGVSSGADEEPAGGRSEDYDGFGGDEAGGDDFDGGGDDGESAASSNPFDGGDE